MAYAFLAIVYGLSLFSVVYPERAARVIFAGTFDTHAEWYRVQTVRSMRMIGIGIVIGLPIILIDVWPST